MRHKCGSLHGRGFRCFAPAGYPTLPLEAVGATGPRAGLTVKPPTFSWHGWHNGSQRGHDPLVARQPCSALAMPSSSRWGNLPTHALSFLHPRDIRSFRHSLPEVGLLVVAAADVPSASRSFYTFASYVFSSRFLFWLGCPVSTMARQLVQRTLLLSSLLLGPATAQSIVYVTDLAIYTYLVRLPSRRAQGRAAANMWTGTVCGLGGFLQRPLPVSDEPPPRVGRAGRS